MAKMEILEFLFPSCPWDNLCQEEGGGGWSIYGPAPLPRGPSPNFFDNPR